MAHIVKQDSLDLISLLDFPGMLDTTDIDMSINFDELSRIVNGGYDCFDNTKLAEDNWLDVGNTTIDVAQPAAPNAVVVQQPAAQLLQPSGLEANSPEICLLEPAAPDHFIRSPTPEMYTLQAPTPEMYTLQAPTPEMYTLQVPTPEPYALQAPTPEPYALQVPTPEPYALQVPTPEPYALQVPTPEPYALQVPTPEPYIIHPASVQQLAVSDSEEESLASPSTVEEASPATQETADAPKKRGRKRKYPEGTAPPRRCRPKKVKVYELSPMTDEKAEKKRKNAINAKRHRDLQKEERNKLAKQLEEVTADRDRLKQLVQQLQQRELQLQKLVKQQHQREQQLLNVHGIQVITRVRQ